ncbi:hypothetical protein P280DRAFT_117820 [Massarina eburnea CBS 473.64]|uniref:Uncharacterized protein n=1 Tax=Massarina eburnea CBS 473.64 TaxID=1395130 RepID=A0A6A6SCR9_9PLEO|nr:hypothetical protein P280DRAFT_117820 [Massarina eburnea CBS 473.64]
MCTAVSGWCGLLLLLCLWVAYVGCESSMGEVWEEGWKETGVRTLTVCMIPLFFHYLGGKSRLEGYVSTCLLISMLADKGLDIS